MEPQEGKMPGTQTPQDISTKQARIAELAKQMPGVALRTLAHHIDIAWLREAYQRTRKDGATGVDGRTAAEYAAQLEENLESLLDRAKDGDRYRAPPVRRVYIPKGDGLRKRPLGIPTFEDKVLQRAVQMVLEPIYEQEFLDCSYGFRRGRSAHDALLALDAAAMKMRGGWVLEVDVEAFFDSVDHAQLRELIQRMVRDGVVLRLIGKWLKAGVSEDGCVYHPETGTPQGGVISPLLANIYLHEVLDVWFEGEVRPRLRGRAVLVRFADDFVILFEREDDARRVQAVLPKRFGKFGLRLHPDKTRLVRFLRPPLTGSRKRFQGPETFDFLGFTLYWGRSRKGNGVVKWKTAKSRFSRALRLANAWCRASRHRPLKEQHEILCRKLRGHDSYYGVSGNIRMLDNLRYQVARIWRKWLCRRSRNARGSWEWMQRVLEVYPLPPPRIVHAHYGA
jgi:RNA-directed DNA polymerase